MPRRSYAHGSALPSAARSHPRPACAARTVDAASLGALRALLGAVLVVAVGRYFVHGWIDAQFHAPRWYFTYPGFAWVRPWPRPWMHVHFACMGAAALALALGYHHRIAAGAFCLLHSYAHLVDQTNYLNHYYLVSLVTGLLTVLPASAWGSVDAARRTGVAHERVPALAIGVVRFQVATVYFFAGVAKLTPDWLGRAQPLRTWLSTATELPLVGAWVAAPSTAHVASVGGAIFDLAIPFLLLARRTRPWAFATLVAFHCTTAALLPIGLFPWIMLACATVFLDPSWPRVVLTTLRRSMGAGPPPCEVPPARGAPACAPTGAGRWIACAAAGLYAGVQVLLPLRSGGPSVDRLWDERGMRWSWRVMVMEKVGVVRFQVRDASSDVEWTVDPSSELTPVQVRAMATQPEMILAYARHLHDAAEQGLDVEVRAAGRVSLNGRPGQPLVDPTVDLAHLPRGAVAADVVLPLEAGPAPAAHPRVTR